MTTGSNFDESAAIGNFWTDTIYPREFKDGSGKFLNIVTEENGDTSVEYYPPFPSRNRIKLTVTFVRASGDIKEVTLKKFKQLTAKGISRWEEQYWGPESPMSFTHFTFEKLLAFLKLITELDLANLNQLYRIGAFIGVAAILWLAAFAYQRFFTAAAKTTETKNETTE